MLQEPGTRETRYYAHELKFLVPADTGREILAWSRARTAADPHGSGPHGDEYRTTSVYFDTEPLDVYHRRGSFARSKYRIRRYGQHRVVFLERKLRTRNVLTKRRTAVPAEAALAELAARPAHPAWAGHWFRKRVDVRRLRPVCQISYDRAARTTMTASGPARLTIDRHLIVRPVGGVEFQAATARDIPVVTAHAVVEIKFVGHPPALFKELVETFALEPAVMSKYRRSVDALRHAGAAPEPAGRPAITLPRIAHA
jgi:hypothetical protein